MKRGDARLPVRNQHKRSRTLLSHREREILDLLVEECGTNVEIGQRLQISEETVKRHLGSIMDKTGYSTRLELAVRTLEKKALAATACPCGVVKRAHPKAAEELVPGGPATPAEYRIYDPSSEERVCLGRSRRSFSQAWIRAARLLALEPAG